MSMMQRIVITVGHGTPMPCTIFTWPCSQHIPNLSYLNLCSSVAVLPKSWREASKRAAAASLILLITERTKISTKRNVPAMVMYGASVQRQAQESPSHSRQQQVVVLAEFAAALQKLAPFGRFRRSCKGNQLAAEEEEHCHRQRLKASELFREQRAPR